MLALRYPTSKWLTDGDVSLHKRLWAADLKDFSDERVRKALGMVRDTHPSFPPTIGEFRQLVASTPRALAIEASPICSNCRSTRMSAIHAEMCGGSKE
jgi:hypothetical protein